MKKNLLSFIKKISAITLMAPMLFVSQISAQQILQSSYAADEFNTDGNLITVFGSGRVKVTKDLDNGLIKAEYVELDGGTTDDYIRFTFASAMDLSSLSNRRVRINFENDQDMVSSFAFSNNSYGPYTNNIMHGGMYLDNTDGSDEDIDVKFTGNDVPTRGDFDNTNVISAYLILNPTYYPSDKVAAGTLIINSIIIGDHPVAGLTIADGAPKPFVRYNTENKTIQYSNLPELKSDMVIYDAVGKLVNNKSLSSASGEVEASNLAIGLYHVQIIENDARQSFKIVVQ